MISPPCLAIASRFDRHRRGGRRRPRQWAFSDETMTKRMIDRTVRRAALGAVVAIVAALSAADVAQPQSADCARLRQAIADASRNDQGAQYQAAAERQREELDRTDRLRPLDRLRPQAIPVLRLGAAAPMRPDQRADRAHARQSRRIAVARGRRRGRARRIDRALQRAMRQRGAGAADELSRSLVRRPPPEPNNVETVPLNPDATQEKPPTPIPARRARDRKRSACAPATAASSRFRIRRAAGVCKASKTCATRSARTRT